VASAFDDQMLDFDEESDGQALSAQFDDRLQLDFPEALIEFI